MVSGCCGCGVAAVVQSRAETERRRRPGAETVQLLEHSQWQLLQTESTGTLHVFMWLVIFIFLSKYLYSTQR